jgi:hypothetical protein
MKKSIVVLISICCSIALLGYALYTLIAMRNDVEPDIEMEIKQEPKV